MTPSLTIDFVSDVSCPWCVIGLYSLEQAIARLGPEQVVTLRFQPFELNPDMPPEGQDINEHLTAKYGAAPAQLAQSREALRQRAAELGFVFNIDQRSRIYNTFAAHRLLHWAQGEQQVALKKALFDAYFTRGQNPGDFDVLLTAAVSVGMDRERCEQLLRTDECAAEVREREAFYQRQGIHAVPAVIINEKYLIQGGQPPEVFERALRHALVQA